MELPSLAEEVCFAFLSIEACRTTAMFNLLKMLSSTAVKSVEHFEQRTTDRHESVFQARSFLENLHVGGQLTQFMEHCSKDVRVVSSKSVVVQSLTVHWSTILMALGWMTF